MVLAVATALLTVGVGFCVFDGPHGDAGEHGMSLDLCLALLIFSVGVTLLSSLSEVGRAPATALPRVQAIAPIVPAPPPKFAAAA